MISRYEIKEVSNIWDIKSKYNYFLKVELALISALEKNKIAPAGSMIECEKAVINIERINELELTTKHDVIAFCSSITEQIPNNVAKFFHYGVTSSDIIDTALSLQLKDSLDIILKDVSILLENLKELALKHKNNICMGRSHGIYAEPMSLGQKFLSYYNELKRSYIRLQNNYNEELCCQFSGAVGNYTILNTTIEKDAASQLGLPVENVSTQIISKDHLSTIIHTTSQIAICLERLAIELRHHQRSEVGTIFEGFSKGQKGSSTMPHKKNPISSENITGLCRLLKSHSRVAEDNNLLWHERDISHSSNERLYLPDHFGILSYILRRMDNVITNLYIDTDKMEQNVFDNDFYLSSYLLHQLILKTNLSREDIYIHIQEIAFKSNEQKLSIKDLFNQKMKSLNINYTLTDINIDELRKIYLSETDQIFNRSLN